MAKPAVLQNQIQIGVSLEYIKPILEPALCLAINIQTKHRASDYEEVGWGRPGSSTQTEHSPGEVSTEGTRYNGVNFT